MHPLLEFFIPQISQQLKGLKIGATFTYSSENDRLFGILTIGEKMYHVVYLGKETHNKQNLQDQLNLDLVRIFYKEYNQMKKTTSNFDFEIAMSKLHNITFAVRNPFLMLQINPSRDLDRKIYDFVTGALNIKLIDELIVNTLKRLNGITAEKIQQLKDPESMLMPMIKLN